MALQLLKGEPIRDCVAFVPVDVDIPKPGVVANGARSIWRETVSRRLVEEGRPYGLERGAERRRFPYPGAD